MVRLKPSRKVVWGLLAGLALVAVPTLTMAQDRSQAGRTAVADAAQAGDREALVRC